MLESILMFVPLVLLVGAAVRLRARLREPLADLPLLDDAAVRAIETTGRVEVDDELDLAVIDDEERRFWEDGAPEEQDWE